MKKNIEVSVESNMLLLLQNKTNDYENRVACGIKTIQGWREFTYKGVGLMSRKIASYLMNELDFKKGEKLAVLSESKPEYSSCVFASVLSGATLVPLDVKLTKYELHSILSNCEPRVMLVSAHYLETALELKKELSFIEHIIVIDEMHHNKEVTTIYNIPDNYDSKWRRPSLRQTAVLIYTSGTTGNPKGVEISYLNIITQLREFSKIKKYFFPTTKDVAVLSILPMNHLFELTVGFSAFMHWGMSIYYTTSLRPKDILSVMREKKVKFMLTVPAFLKLLKASIENQVSTMPKAKQLAFKFIYEFARFVPSFYIRKLMFYKIHEKFGGKFGGCISGGAPLDPEVGKFFERIGIKVYQGYGLSETSPVVSVNYEKRHNVRTVGRPFSSFEAKIDKSTGELLLRGKSVMKGYYKQPELTAETIDKDGWLHTGDIAQLDREGFLYITGRIKNMIVLSGGKKVFPEEVESVLEKSDKFKELCVFGSNKTSGSKEGCEEIMVVIVPADNVVGTDEEIETQIRNEVKTLSSRLAPYKRPVNIVIMKEPLPRTTTRKIKRNQVKELVGAV